MASVFSVAKQLSVLQRTPLFEQHQKLGARLVEFGGWEMPVQYAGIAREHQAVRRAAGLFDIAHMGEFILRGASAGAFLNHVLTNELNRLPVGLGQYTLMCNGRGGVVDDLYVYRIAEREFLLIVNASRIDADLSWLQTQGMRLSSGSLVENCSATLGAVAVQGPKVAEFIGSVLPGQSSGGAAVGSILELKKNEIAAFGWRGQSLWAGRTGYTGEDGFELIAPRVLLPELWNLLLAAGKQAGLEPAGLGARDTLRTEMGYPLYGHELDETTTPLEAGLGAFVALGKADLVGGAALRSQKASGLTRRCVAFKMTGKAPPPRPGYAICKPGLEQIGTVTSGTQSPSLGIGIGMGFVPVAEAPNGTALEIEIRGHRFPAVVVPKPIYRQPAGSLPS